MAIVVGALLRLAWVIYHPNQDSVYSDMDGYLDRAIKIATGEELGRYDAFWPPGTHLLLTAPLAILGPDRLGLWAATLLWATMSSVTPYLAWRLGRTLLTPAAAALTTILVALSPLYITNAGYFLSETPSLAFLLGSLWLGHRAASLAGRAATVSLAAAGLLGGIAVLNRPQLILNLAVVAVPLLRRPGPRMRRLAALAAPVAVMIAVAAVHNTIAAGQPTGISENTGLTFYLGHCDVRVVRTLDEDGTFFEFAAPVALQRGGGGDYYWEGVTVWDQGFFLARGLDCIGEDGVGHLGLIGRSLIDMTSTTILWPQSNEDGLKDVVNVANIVYSGTLPLVLAAAILLIRRRRRRGQPSGEAYMLAHLACALPTAILFFGDPRFRLPYDIFGFALLAAVIAHHFIDRR